MILSHEGRLPLPPYITMQACVLEGRTVSGAHYPDVLLILFLHGHSWILKYSFFQGEEPSRFSRASSGQEGQCHFRGHCTQNTPRPYETNYTQTGTTHTHLTQRDTLKHTLRELGRQYALASPQPGFLERVPRYVTRQV